MKTIAILAFAAISASAQDQMFFKVNAEHVEFDNKTVTGAPYSAQGVTETTQVLADGNRIVHKTTSSIARDSMGRTRREQSLGFVGPWAADGKPANLVMINDPVASTRYTLDANSHTAMKMPAPTSDMEAKLRVLTRAKLDAEHGATLSTSPASVPILIKDNIETADRVSTPQTPAKVESLGVQEISGVQAEGKRVTETIPAGKIGNDRDINIVNETWYSPELQITVMSKYSDPRSGDVVYTLTNVNRAEPDPTLFQVPADYKVREEPGAMTIQASPAGTIAVRPLPEP